MGTITFSPFASFRGPKNREHALGVFGQFNQAYPFAEVPVPTPSASSVVSWIGDPPVDPADFATLSVFSQAGQKGVENKFYPGTYSKDDFAQYNLVGNMASFQVGENSKATFVSVDGAVNIRGPNISGDLMTMGKDFIQINVEHCDDYCLAGIPSLPGPSDTGKAERLTSTPVSGNAYFASSSDAGAVDAGSGSLSWFWIFFLIFLLVAIYVYLRIWGPKPGDSPVSPQNGKI